MGHPCGNLGVYFHKCEYKLPQNPLKTKARYLTAGVARAGFLHVTQLPKQEAWVLFHRSLLFAAEEGPSGIFCVMIRMVPTESLIIYGTKAPVESEPDFVPLFIQKTHAQCLEMPLVPSSSHCPHS